MQMLPRLIPAKVPWKVASDGAFLELIAPSADRRMKLIFTAHFRCHPAAEGQGLDLIVVHPPKPYHPARDDERSEYQRVKLTFHEVFKYRRVPAMSDTQTVDPSLFDWSGIPTSRLLPNESVYDLLARVESHFEETGCAPDPSFYKVEGSTWFERGEPSDREHFLLSSDTEYVEIIASRWDWELGQAES